MQIRPKKNNVINPEKTPKISESHQNTTEKREKHMKLEKNIPSSAPRPLGAADVPI